MFKNNGIILLLRCFCIIFYYFYQVSFKIEVLTGFGRRGPQVELSGGSLEVGEN